MDALIRHLPHTISRVRRDYAPTAPCCARRAHPVAL
jgi:hypothetical protein